MVFSTISRSSVELMALPDFAQRGELTTDLVQRLGARLQLLEQAHVLDRDHRLIGEGFRRSICGLENGSHRGAELIVPMATPFKTMGT